MTRRIHCFNECADCAMIFPDFSGAGFAASARSRQRAVMIFSLRWANQRLYIEASLC
jgi:hypothetical protein